MRKTLVAAAALMLAACGKPTAPGIAGQVQLPSPVEVWLTIGGSVVADSTLRVTFVAVPADSRCPSSVVCVWQGDAAVAITSEYVGGGAIAHDTIHLNVEPRSVQVGGYHVALLLLGPEPFNTNPIPADEYAARLRIVMRR